MKSKALLFVICATLSVSVFAQNVGIGTTTPAYKLDVAGIINSSSNTYVGGSVGIGTMVPSYKLQIDDGSVALHSTTDAKYWVMSYSSSGNYFNINEGGISRMAILNGGNVGIGTASPATKLDVAGSANIDGNTTVGGAAAVTGSLTVNSGKGVLYNLTSSANIKYYTRSAAFTVVNLAAHTLSPETTIGFTGGFSSAPQVYAGNITTTGGTTGPLYQLQLVIYDVTPTSCHVRILNNSNSTINQSCTWNIMCMGN